MCIVLGLVFGFCCVVVKSVSKKVMVDVMIVFMIFKIILLCIVFVSFLNVRFIVCLFVICLLKKRNIFFGNFLFMVFLEIKKVCWSGFFIEYKIDYCGILFGFSKL